jgi:hypothetical protein
MSVNIPNLTPRSQPMTLIQKHNDMRSAQSVMQYNHRTFTCLLSMQAISVQDTSPWPFTEKHFSLCAVSFYNFLYNSVGHRETCTEIRVK